MLEQNGEAHKRCEPDDPNRCQTVNVGSDGGQCTLLAIPGCTNCGLHGGVRQQQQIEKQNIRMMQLTQFNERFTDLSGHLKIQSLSEEIGILRMMIEARINKCTNTAELMIHSQGINELVKTVASLVQAASKLDLQAKTTLTKPQADAFAGAIAGILQRFVPPEIMETVIIEIDSALCSLIGAS